MARRKRQDDTILESCQEELSYDDQIKASRNIIIDHEKTVNGLTEGIAYNVKIFATAFGITSQREISRSSSDMQLIKSERSHYDNNSTLEQLYVTSEYSEKNTETISTAVSSTWEVYGEIGLDIGGEISIPFLAKSKADLKMKVGLKHNWGETVTNTVSKEVNTLISRQTVKCPPRKRIEMTFNFFSFVDTIGFFIDLELDGNKSYVGSLQLLVQRTEDDSIIPLRWKRVRHCVLLEKYKDLGQLSEETCNALGIVIENGKYILKNFPIKVKVESYHGEMKTQEFDLD